MVVNAFGILIWIFVVSNRCVYEAGIQYATALLSTCDKVQLQQTPAARKRARATNPMDLRIFDVEHGQCSHIVTSTNRHVLIDAGHNSTPNWRPSTYLPRRGISHIDKLIILNFDEDHASDLHNLVETVSVGTLTKNPSVSPQNLRRLKDIGGIGPRH